MAEESPITSPNTQRPATPAAARASTAPATKRSFIVRHPTIKNGEVMGIELKDGTGRTEDSIRAHASQEAGCEVLDAATNKPAWPEE
jgi:hypothetical protein